MQVSILVFYNEDRGYLGEAFDSFRDQDYAGMYEIIMEHGPGKSSAENFNNGVLRCGGTFVKACAEDDMLTPNCLRHMVPVAVKYSIDVLVANAINFYPDGGEVRVKSRVPKTVTDLVRKNTIHGGAVLYRKSALLNIGLMRTGLNYAEEYDLNIRLARSGARFGYINTTVFRYRCWDAMKSMQTRVIDGNAYIKRKNEIQKTVNNIYKDAHEAINICYVADNKR